MKAVLVMDMPERCLECQMLNGSDECILQSDDQNFEADTFDKLMEGCPPKPMPEKLKVDYNPDGSILIEAEKAGWNACIDEIMGGME